MGMKKKEINYQLLIRRICLIVLEYHMYYRSINSGITDTF